jgi:vacuolar-type H+-ATPase subunit I/STV1
MFNNIIEKSFKDELYKLAFESDQIKKGIEVESEHKDTVQKIKDSIKNNKITLSNKDIFKSISEDHLKENPTYYDKLEKMEQSFEKKAQIAFLNELQKIADSNWTAMSGNKNVERFYSNEDLIHSLSQHNKPSIDITGIVHSFKTHPMAAGQVAQQKVKSLEKSVGKPVTSGFGSIWKKPLSKLKPAFLYA